MKKNLLSKILFPTTLLLATGAMVMGGARELYSANAEIKVTASSTLHVKKVDNLSEDFIMGMDVSSVISEENSGVKYYDYDGQEADVFKVLNDSGINYIRVRIWNDPKDEKGNYYGGGNNDLATAIKIGKRATANNMKLLVDFHYSDFWADPAKQMKPKAWEDLYGEDLNDALYSFTKESLQAMKDENIDVGMVQIGNEINGYKMAGSDGIKSEYFGMLNAGSKAVREVFDEALIALHFANPEKHKYSEYAQWAKQYEVDYDVFGSSYYPYWHGTLENLASELSQIATTYNKKTMVLETSYAYTEEDTDGHNNTIGSSGYDAKPYPFTVAGQANSIRDITDTIANKTTNGIGICYWEGTWISVGDTHDAGYSYEANKAKWAEYGSGWASEAAASYDPDDVGTWWGGCAVDNQAMFDAHGHPLESLKVFGLMKEGNDAPRYVDGIENVEMIKNDNEDFTLPETVNVIYNTNERAAVPVVWDNFDIEAAKKNGNAKYVINGKAEGLDVTCTLQILEANYIQNYSFESKTTGWKVTDNGSKTGQYKVTPTSENPQTGTYAFHFWGGESGQINFDVEQELTGLKTANYKYQISLMGGNGGSGNAKADLQNIYAFVKVNDILLAKVDGKVTKYKEWTNLFVDNLPIKEGQKVVVGFHVESSEAGIWGDIDDCMFNRSGEYNVLDQFKDVVAEIENAGGGSSGNGGGCGGSIVATSSILFVLSICGLALFIARRKQLQ